MRFLKYFSVFLTAPGHKNALNFAALNHMIFSKLHLVPNMILHQIVYILLHNCKNGGLKSTKSGGFPEKLPRLLYRTVLPNLHAAR